jgi:hypothetical protein
MLDQAIFIPFSFAFKTASYSYPRRVKPKGRTKTRKLCRWAQGDGPREHGLLVQRRFAKNCIFHHQGMMQGCMDYWFSAASENSDSRSCA